MIATILVSHDQLRIYREAARKREADERQWLSERFQRAWLAAEMGAALLKTEYGASRVVVFGSLADELLFHQHSDIDLAAWGLDREEYLSALADLLSPYGEFSFDLVIAEDAHTNLLATIEREGIEL